MNWRMQLMNELMELVYMTASSNGLSENQKERMKKLYNALTESGKDYIQIWAEENDREIPSYVLN